MSRLELEQPVGIAVCNLLDVWGKPLRNARPFALGLNGLLTLNRKTVPPSGPITVAQSTRSSCKNGFGISSRFLKS